jgi:RNA polymerase sigma-70 factor, ECF subfamily
VAEEAEFDAFYACSYPRVVRQVFALTNDYAEAQDITQDAFIRAWRRWPKLRAFDRPEAWVRTVACREAISRWRRARTLAAAILRYGALARVPSPGPGPDHVALISALARIPSQQRLVLVLHYLGDMPVDEIAREIGCPPGSVKSRLSRGRDALAALLGDSADNLRVDSATSSSRDRI